MENVDTNKLLHEFHPDYDETAVTNLTIGANHGERCHKQIANILQADAKITEADIAGTKKIHTDTLVIGSGGAGCAAAITAKQQGAEVIIATKLRAGDSNTVMAEGGIQASIEPGDSVEQHYKDTLTAGHNHGDKELIASLTKTAPEVIQWLIKQGMQFDTNKFGDLLTRRAGGTSADRVVYFKDYTGLEMMRVLRESVRNLGIPVWDYSPTIELLSNEHGECAGAVIWSISDNRYTIVQASSVILATGGIGRVHLNDFPTSNHFGATGDGLVLAYRLGAKLTSLDSFQYHPTGVAAPKLIAGSLITEGVRSAGVKLLNKDGNRFIDELLPRDVVTAAILKECEQGRGVRTEQGEQGVWMDTPSLEKEHPGILQKMFPKLLRMAATANVDISREPLLIYPTLHYQNGGVMINKRGQTSVKGLLAAGEVSGGIHGRNRLMGNALLDIISFGRNAGAYSATQIKHRGNKQINLEHLNKLHRARSSAGITTEHQSPMLFPEYYHSSV